jgi:hypothetical protein
MERMNSRQGNNRGFNLIEAAIVLGLVGLVVGGIWSAASNYLENQRVQRYAADILSINQCVKNKFPRLQCDSVLCHFSTWYESWAQTKFFDDIGCIPASIERRKNGGATIYYDGFGKVFFTTLYVHSGEPALTIGIGGQSGASPLQQNKNSVSECAKFSNSIARAARSKELSYIQVGIHTHPDYASLSLADWTNICSSGNGTSVAIRFKP